jgi:hypothetical protein
MRRSLIAAAVLASAPCLLAACSSHEMCNAIASSETMVLTVVDSDGAPATAIAGTVHFVAAGEQLVAEVQCPSSTQLVAPVTVVCSNGLGPNDGAVTGAVTIAFVGSTTHAHVELSNPRTGASFQGDVPLDVQARPTWVGQGCGGVISDAAATITLR